MVRGDEQPAEGFEDLPLPQAKAIDFDLSADKSAFEQPIEEDPEAPQKPDAGEPEGIFDLFDREFKEESRSPLDPGESSKFDREFSESFDQMFRAVKGDGSAPLFEPEAIDQKKSESASQQSEATDQKVESPMLPRPKLEPEELRALEGEEEEELPLILDRREESPELAPAPPAPMSLEDEELSFPMEEDDPLIDPPLDDLPSIDIDSDEDYEDSFSAPISMDPTDSIEDEEPLGDWGAGEQGLEELNFDESDEEELYDSSLGGDSAEDEEDFDEFVKLALGIEDEEEGEEDEDEFTVEELRSTNELDPFEDMAIMSSEDVADYEPGFQSEELRFEEDSPLPEDSDPFGSAFEEEELIPEEETLSEPEEEDFEGLDPFSEEAAALSEAKKKDQEAQDDKAEEDEPEEEKKPKEKRKPKTKKRSSKSAISLGSLRKLLRLPWTIYSKLASLVFGVLETAISVLGKIPLLGLPFRMLGSVLSAVPMSVKRLIPLVLIGGLVWGGSAVINGLLPKAGAQIELPDSGSARFFDVELENGVISGSIENTGDIELYLVPEVAVRERQILNPGSWFSPTELGTCTGDIATVAIDETVPVSYECAVEGDGIISLKLSLSD